MSPVDVNRDTVADETEMLEWLAHYDITGLGRRSLLGLIREAVHLRARVKDLESQRDYLWHQFDKADREVRNLQGDR